MKGALLFYRVWFYNLEKIQCVNVLSAIIGLNIHYWHGIDGCLNKLLVSVLTGEI